MTTPDIPAPDAAQVNEGAGRWRDTAGHPEQPVQVTVLRNYSVRSEVLGSGRTTSMEFRPVRKA
jgi:hypothetical protein